MTHTAEAVFGRRRQSSRRGGTYALTFPRIQALLSENRLIGGSLLLLRCPDAARVSPVTLTYLHSFRQRLTLTNGWLGLVSDALTVNALMTRRKRLARELYAARAEEAYRRSRESDRRKIKTALMGGSTKKLVNVSGEFAGLPLIVNKLGSDDL